jgi:hypothetical protein
MAKKKRPPLEPTCSNCRYWRPNKSDKGRCYRFPAYEIKRDDEWCGELKLQEKGERITE